MQAELPDGAADADDEGDAQDDQPDRLGLLAGRGEGGRRAAGCASTNAQVSITKAASSRAQKK